MVKGIKRPLSLVEATMEGIRNSIINGDLSLGQQLTESNLQKSFGFSKTPIREALGRLVAEGLVESEVHKGFKVFKMDEKELSDFCELRLALESQALKTSYENNRAALIREIKLFIKDMTKSIKNNEFLEYRLIDSKFHKCFFTLSSNRFLTKNYENIHSLIETIKNYSFRGLIDQNKLKYSNAGHIAICRHIEDKNLTLALSELEKHINSWFKDRMMKSEITHK